MTKVFIADVSKLNSDYSMYKDLVSDAKYNKLVYLKRDEDVKLSLGVELLLADYLGRKPHYYIDEHGKPQGEEIHFNFSHSGTIAVCAVSDNPVGIDVEKIRGVNIDVAKKKFCEDEYINILESENPEETFLEYWVKKESYLKAVGEGIKAGLDSFNVDKVDDYKFYMYNIDGYKICVCSSEKQIFYEKSL